jgi:F-type H+-transporting ATPase subunit epsilon
MKTFKTQILTPDGSVFDGETVSVKVPGSQGQFQVLHNHAALMSSLTVGTAEISDSENNEQLLAISGGFVEVNNNEVTVLAQAAERPEEIDVERAKEAEERARKRLKDNKMDTARADAALKRAVNRINLADKYQPQS